MLSRTESVINYLKFLLKCQLIFIESDRPAHLSLIIIANLTCVILYTLCFADHEIKDVSVFIQNLNIYVVMVLSYVKLLTVAHHGRGLSRLFHDILHELPRNPNGSQTVYQRKATWVTYLMVCIMSTGTFSFEVVYIAVRTARGELPVIAMVSYLSPPNNATAYVLNSVQQIVAFLTCFCSTLSSDGVLVLSMMHLEAGLDALLDKTNNLNEETAEVDLRDMWKYHMVIMSFRNRIRDIFAVQLSVQYIVSIGVLCCSMYGLAGGSAYMALLVFLTVVEILALCYVGQQIQTKSEMLFRQLYFTPWLQFRHSEQRRLLTMMTVSRRALTITSPFADLELETFGQVIKTAYSMYTLLHKVR